MSCLDIVPSYFLVYFHTIYIWKVSVPSLVFLTERVIFFLHVKNHNTGFVVSSSVILH